MNEEHTALVARLERMMSLNHNGAERLRDDTIAAITALAGELDDEREMHKDSTEALCVEVDETERLRAEVAKLAAEVTRLANYAGTLRAEVERLKCGMDARHDELMHIHGLHDTAIAEVAASRRIIERAAAWFATHTIAAPHNKADSIAREMNQWLAALADKPLSGPTP